MQFWLCLLFLALGNIQSSVAQTHEVFRDQKSGNLILSGNSKPEVDALLLDFRRWKEKLGEPVGLLPLVRKAGTHYTVDLTSSVPELANECAQRAPVQGEINCFGTALSLVGMVSRPIDLTIAGNDYGENPWTRFPGLCEPTDKPEIGDMGVIRRVDKGTPPRIKELHAFVYVSPQVCFSKNGGASASAMKFQPLNEVLNGYLRNGDEKDINTLLYFRCHPERLKAAADKDSEYKSLDEQLRRLEEAQYNLYMDHAQQNCIQNKNSVLDILLQNRIHTAAMKHRSDSDLMKRALWSTLEMRLNGYYRMI